MIKGSLCHHWQSLVFKVCLGHDMSTRDCVFTASDQYKEKWDTKLVMLLLFSSFRLVLMLRRTMFLVCADTSSQRNGGWDVNKTAWEEESTKTTTGNNKKRESVWKHTFVNNIKITWRRLVESNWYLNGNAGLCISLYLLFSLPQSSILLFHSRQPLIARIQFVSLFSFSLFCGNDYILWIV